MPRPKEILGFPVALYADAVELGDGGEYFGMTVRELHDRLAEHMFDGRGGDDAIYFANGGVRTPIHRVEALISERAKERPKSTYILLCSERITSKPAR